MRRIMCDRKSGKFAATLARLEAIPWCTVIVPNQEVKDRFPKKFHDRIFTPE